LNKEKFFDIGEAGGRADTAMLVFYDLNAGSEIDPNAKEINSKIY